VGDIKPGEYGMEFFLDLAWDIDAVEAGTIGEHLRSWAGREFGKNNGKAIARLMCENFRLAFLRKPEFMGWGRTEPTTDTRPGAFNPHANGNELQRRIDAYRDLYRKTRRISKRIPEGRRGAYFQLVEYPVCSAALMNFKFLYGRLSCDAQTPALRRAAADSARAAYEEIRRLTGQYNHQVSRGKWNRMMDMQPRELPAYQMPDWIGDCGPFQEDTASLAADWSPLFLDAADFKAAMGRQGYHWIVVDGLGYSNRAVTLAPFETSAFPGNWPGLSYRFDLEYAGTYRVEVRCLPTHSNTCDQSLKVSLDGAAPVEYALNTRGRSEEWKANVLRNYVPVIYGFVALETGSHSLTVSANQTGIVIDQIAVIPEGYPAFYEIPAADP